MERFAWRDLGSRPLFFPALSLVLGALWPSRTGAAAGAFLLGGALLVVLGGTLARLPGAHLAVLLGLGLTGSGLAGLEARVDIPPSLARGGAARLEGEVDRVDAFDGATRVGLVVARAGPLDGPMQPARFRASLTARGARALLPGQRIQAETRLAPDAPPANPGERDLSSPRRRRGVAFTGSLAADRLLVLSPAPAWRSWVEDARGRLAEAVHAVAPSRDSAALFLTLAAGQRAALDDTWEEAFSRAGLAHVLSVSGLHVAALALMTLALLRWLLVRVGARWRRLDARRVAAPVSVPFVWAYVFFTGNQPPAVRSAVMATVVLLGLALWRRADGLNSLASAALVLVVGLPSSVVDLSLRLSFLAVLGLILLSPALRAAIPLAPPDPQETNRMKRWLGKAREAVLQTLCASAAATLSGLPIVAEAFGRVSVAGLASNIVALPLCGLLTGLAAGGAALFVLSPLLATPVLWAGAWASQLLLGVTRIFSALPFAAVEVPGLGVGMGLAYAAGLGLWALGSGRWRWGGALVPAAVVLTVLLPSLRPTPALRLTFLAVGQGDAVVLSSRGHHALLDAGGVPQGADPGERIVVPFLRHAGISHLELAVLSHPHPDHALGLVSTLAKVPTERLWLAAGTAEGALSRAVVDSARGAVVEQVELGHPSVKLGEATLEVLGPPRDRELMEGVNDQSIVLRVRHGDVTVLLPGDVEAEGEAALLEHLGGPVTVMKAPHHGSRTSSSEELLTRARPRHVVFCVGRRNRFGFPHEEVLTRYAAMGTTCWRTDVDGAITLESDGQDVRMVPFLTGETAPAATRVAERTGDSHP
ncbi:DNA internalization-related competence protein ComEC/Rec2 [Corallococcus sp. H22C18031201]|uniref:DNA internalization-related competence protein ComEC/Rec2 n=1 Tax=Citreicoccus inhibens TaxID=2849499 RepID=UPI000E737EDA|nr:DNA internalization-related competence protein ComEC/Rec2 [Citreicoccus inhibens]MBU8898278.1 DNA internalization-related competence protein ComEC/Rec2 [Citreicoccus inhibens]RJS27006.1 DNA internalization-related competence protein ComEC/Rec2 [Corallococcus sp. H22C18031201]